MDYKKFESIRRAYAKKLSWIIGLSCAAALVSLPFLLFLFPLYLIVFIICYLFIPRKERERYQAAYREYFVTKALSETFSSFHHSASGLPLHRVSETGMINTGDHYRSNDLITGTYKDVNFAQADVHITEEHNDSEGHTSESTVFRGRYLIFEFKKKFGFRLAVVGKGFHAARLRHQKDGRKFSRVSLESPMFNKLFKTYAEDGFEAFYLLDPAFLDRAERLAEAHKKRVFLGFSGNLLHVAIQDGKDSLEPPAPFKRLDEAKEFAKIKTDLKLITDIVDTLKLQG